MSAALIECDVYPCDGTIEDDYIEGTIFSEDEPLIFGKGGNDEIYGTMFIDKIFGGNGDDQIYAKSNNDNIYGEYGDDEIHGNDGDDYIEGGEGSDTINRGAGNDKITAGTNLNEDPDYSKDTITCGLGYDIVYINQGEDEDGVAEDCQNVNSHLFK